MEDGYFESLVEAEGVVGLPVPGSPDGYVRIIGREGDETGAGELFEIDRLPYPSLAVIGGEVVEPDSEIAFELGGVALGVDAELLEEGGHGCWVLGRVYCLGVW